MSSEEIKPDAWATFSNSYRVLDDLEADEEHLIVEDDTHKQPLYSADTIKQLWINDYKKSILGEADELRERGEADVAAQLEHIANRFEKVFSTTCLKSCKRRSRQHERDF